MCPRAQSQEQRGCSLCVLPVSSLPPLSPICLLTSSARWAWGWLSRKVPSRTEPTMVSPFPALSWEVSESSCGCTTFWSWSTRTSTSSCGLSGGSRDPPPRPPPGTYMPHTSTLYRCQPGSCLNVHFPAAMDSNVASHALANPPPPFLPPTSPQPLHLPSAILMPTHPVSAESSRTALQIYPHMVITLSSTYPPPGISPRAPGPEAPG